MIDTNKLEQIFRMWKKSDKNSFEEFVSVLSSEYNNITVGLLTTKEFENIKFLQGIGNFISIILTVANKILKNEEV